MYEKYFKFNTSPFRLSPDPNFFFGSQGHKRAMAYLRYGITQKEGFIVITGAPGTGKTTIARALLQEIGREKVVVSELNTTHLQAEDVLRMVAASFGLEHENAPKSTLLKRLESFFISRFRAGYHVLLLVDEAQNLPNESLEELRMLSNFYLGKDALIQIFLLGQEQFRERLYSSDMEQLRQRVVASCHLEPLNHAESREYIEYRLNQAGWDQDPQLSDRAFARIYAVTKGVPRRINTFCDRLFLYASLEEIHELKDEHIKAVAKELMLEVSAKGVKLSDIKPAENKIPEEVEAESEEVEINTELLKQFSDDTPEISEQEEVESVSENGKFDAEFDKRTKPPEVARESETAFPEYGDEDFRSPTPRDRKSSSGSGFSTQRVSSSSSATVSASPVTQPKFDTAPEWWELVALSVEYYNDPTKFRGLTSANHPVVPAMTELFKVGVGKKKLSDKLRNGILAEVSDKEIQQAVRLYIQNALLSGNADYYRRLGVESSAQLETIRSHYKYLFRMFQPDMKEEGAQWDETFTRRINQAYATLRSEQKRREYNEFISTRKRNKQAKKNDWPAQSVEPAQVSKDSYQTAEQSFDMDESTYVDDLPNTEIKAPKNKLYLAAASFVVLAIAGGAVFFVSKTDVNNFIAGFMPATQVSGSSALGEAIDAEKDISIAKAQALATEDSATSQFDNSLAPVESIIIPDKVNLEDIAEVVEKTLIEKNVIEDVSTPIISAPVIATKIKNSDAKTNKDDAIVKRQETKIVKTEKPVSKKPISNVTKSSLPIKPAQKVEKPVVKKAPVTVAMVTEPAANNPVKIKKSINKITNTELKQFMTNFSIAYEEGNLSEFMKFFTTDAKTNDASDRNSIAKEYNSLFEATEMRVIDLQGLKWNIKKNKAVGKGDFVVTVLRKGGDAMRDFAGSIKLEIKKVNGKLQLRSMYHAYGNEEN